jgi:hypothetical protein
MIAQFDEVWVFDTEYRPQPGDGVTPVSLSAKELHSGQVIQHFFEDGKFDSTKPLIPFSKNSLAVVFYAPAEASVFEAVGVSPPDNILDMWTEVRRLSNRHSRSGGQRVSSSLLSCCADRGIKVRDTAEKAEMVKLILSKSQYSEEERRLILHYNLDDVNDSALLLHKMIERNEIDLARALVRGKYSWLTKTIEQNGIPLDFATFKRLMRTWPMIEEKFVREVDQNFQVFENGSFNAKRFAHYLATHKIPWPRLPTGKLMLDDDTFKMMAGNFPQLQPLRELRKFLGSSRLMKTEVGCDGRNRTSLNPFSSTTSRNQPSNSKNIMGGASFLRCLIQPPKGFALASIDQSQQEFGIAGALSGDGLMMEAYESGDPYLEFAKQAGAVPRDATKKTHPKERDQFKSTALAVQYGMQAESLALRISQPTIYARELLALHHKTYSVFWKWSDQVVRFASVNGYLETTFGWRMQVPYGFNERSIRNFPMQANGAEILRIAVIIAMAEGLKLIATIHDAVMLESSVDRIEAEAQRMVDIFSEASTYVLRGFRLRSDCKIIKYPNVYEDERGKAMWKIILKLMDEVDHES